MRGMVQAFARAGHDCQVAIFVASSSAGAAEWPLAQQLASLHTAPELTDWRQVLVDDNICFRLSGIDYRGISVEGGNTVRQLWHLLDAWQPDALVITDGQHPHCASLLSELARAAPERLIYCPKTVHLLPIGPYSISPNHSIVEALLNIRLVIAPSRFVADVISSVTGREVRHVYFPVYELPELDYATRPSAHAITLINASVLKGLTIFADLVANLRDMRFAAVPGWGTTQSDLKILHDAGNVTMLPFSREVDSIYLPTKILLVPSLCYEALGHVVIEAMLRGIVVIASAHGGLQEAKLGVDFMIPVSPVEIEADAHWRTRRLRLPIQSAGNWIDILTTLSKDRDMYAELSQQSRRAASAFVTSLHWSDIVMLVEQQLGTRVAEGG